MHATTGQCTVCNKLIHKRRSGVHGDLSRVDNGSGAGDEMGRAKKLI